MDRSNLEKMSAEDLQRVLFNKRDEKDRLFSARTPYVNGNNPELLEKHDNKIRQVKAEMEKIEEIIKSRSA